MNLWTATAADLPALKELHLESWRTHYQGIFPQTFLDDVAPRELNARWTPDAVEGWLVVGAGDKNHPSGLILCDPNHDQGPFLESFHVRSDHQGRGLGRSLLSALAGDLRALGHNTLWCLVIEENTQARAAYAALSAQEGEAQPFKIFGQTIMEIPVRWSTLDPLLKAPEISNP